MTTLITSKGIEKIYLAAWIIKAKYWMISNWCYLPQEKMSSSNFRVFSNLNLLKIYRTKKDKHIIGATNMILKRVNHESCSQKCIINQLTTHWILAIVKIKAPSVFKNLVNLLTLTQKLTLYITRVGWIPQETQSWTRPWDTWRPQPLAQCSTHFLTYLCPIATLNNKFKLNRNLNHKNYRMRLNLKAISYLNKRQLLNPLERIKRRRIWNNYLRWIEIAIENNIK